MPTERSKGERLRARRRAQRRIAQITIGVLVVLCIAGMFYLLWQPYLRISKVVVNDGDTNIETLAQNSLTGKVWHILPRNSYFLVPDQAIRSEILRTHPELEAVSIAQPSLTGLAITVTNRVPLARWCGSVYSGEPAATDCYLFDATGFIFTAAASSTATTTPVSGAQPLSELLVYAPLADTGSSTQAIGETIADAKSIAAIFQFSRQLGSLGALVKTVVLRGDEVDLWLASGTRVTYVRGDEESAYALAVSSFPQLKLSDGSIQYVDLRFTASGRVYFKRNGTTKDKESI